ncbi:glycosyltransferase family 2 protein [Aestuariivivens marinum]|uniref:glycosyltransferase family 2 protein n=1 Tax=Aestuariivivens marinum TaxID=2913555 RepID=UPI001F57EEC6|nr:glycosyltransferase family 2 protein [Aestuariivivens marinum]
MKVAIVILNWNGKELLKKFLPSVIEYSKGCDIYVADNASTDDSVEFTKTYFPTINIIQNKINDGYAKGYNDALKQVDADVFCLLNSDVEVSKGWLQPVIDIFESEPNTAIIQPKLLDYNNRGYFEYAGAAGGFIDKYGYPYCRGRIFNTIEKDNGQYNDIMTIFWASGACFFIRSSVFKALNGFDESFFAHMEEIDLCWRAYNSGYLIKYCGESEVYHVGGATLNNQNPKKTFLNFRNSLFTLVKNAKGHILLLLIPRLILDGMAGIKFLLELKFKHTFSVIRAHFSFYRRFLILIEQRKSQKNKRNYYKKKSIVINYFVNNKKHYETL